MVAQHRHLKDSIARAHRTGALRAQLTGALNPVNAFVLTRIALWLVLLGFALSALRAGW